MDEASRQRAAERLLESLPTPDEIREDWGRFIVDMVLPNGVWAREGLSARDRSLITVAALTVLYRPNQLRLHLERALHNGLSREELCEAIMHLAIYGGFPTSVEAMGVAKEVFDETRASGAG